MAQEHAHLCTRCKQYPSASNSSLAINQFILTEIRFLYSCLESIAHKSVCTSRKLGFRSTSRRQSGRYTLLIYCYKMAATLPSPLFVRDRRRNAKVWMGALLFYLLSTRFDRSLYGPQSLTSSFREHLGP